MIGLTGLNALLNAEMELKPEQELVRTLLPLMVVLTVKDQIPKVKHAVKAIVQVHT